MVLTDAPIYGDHVHFAINLDTQTKLLMTYGFGIVEIIMNCFIWNMLAKSQDLNSLKTFTL